MSAVEIILALGLILHVIATRATRQKIYMDCLRLLQLHNNLERRHRAVEARVFPEGE